MAWKDAKTFHAIVFAIDYRVAPEHKFPTGFNDSYNSFKWITEHGKEFGGDPDRIIIMGVSAGANLTAAVSLKAKQEGIAQKIKLQVMNCPVVDNPAHANLYPSMQQNANGYMLTQAGILFALETYADEKDHNNPAYAPILAKNLSGLPPAVMITAEFDPLRDQGIAYAEQLRKAGVKVWSQCFGGEIHCLIPAPDNGAATKTYQQIVSTAMNEVMKVLTIITTLFIPPTFIAGVYGMNFNPKASPLNMPELDWYFGYPFALGLMVILAIGLTGYLIRKGWLLPSEIDPIH
jgi:acetyl esterase